MRDSRGEFITVRGRRCHVRRWGSESAPPLVMLHGWMDMSATFQFVVDSFEGDWNVIAPDWAGFGLSDPIGGPYFHALYMADLDAILDVYAPGSAIALVAHSMGANVALAYCAAFPDRVSHFINVEGLGALPPFGPETELKRLRQFLTFQKVSRTRRTYPSITAFAKRLLQGNPRLKPSQADFLAEQFTRLLGDERELLADPMFLTSPGPPRFTPETIEHFLRQLTMPVLWVTGEDSPLLKRFALEPFASMLQTRLHAPPSGRHMHIADAGHNIQHDQPHLLAKAIEDFLATPGPT